MKAAVIIAIALAILAVALLRYRPTKHLDVTPDARERIEKAKRQ